VASQAYGIDVSLMAQLPLLLREAGLQHIKHQTFRVPVGSWGGRVGTMLEQDILASLPGIKAFIGKNASAPPDTFDRIVGALPSEWRTYQTCYEYYLAYGEKREESNG
jgi:hypothetical protein